MRRAAHLASVLMVLVPAAALANPYLQRAKVLLGQLRYAEAIRQLEVARTVPTGDAPQMLEILDLLGSCLVAEGRRKEAEAAFGELLALDPEAEPAQPSPKIREVFEAARARQPPPAAVRPEEPPLAPPAAAVGGLESPAQEPSVHRVARPAPWVATAVAVVALGAGMVAQGLSHDSAERARGEEWSDTARSLHAQGLTQALWATALFVGAGAAGVTAGILFWW